MAGNSGPDIVTNGLILSLDVANTASYPGTGTQWFDNTQGLTFNSQGTQTPLTTFNGARAFDFNGSGYWACSTNSSLVDLGGDFTLNMWFYCETLPSRNTIFEKAGTIYQSYEQELAITWETDNSFSYYSRYSPVYDYGYIYSATANRWNLMSMKVSSGKSTTARTGFYSVNGVPYTASYVSRSNTALVAAGEIRIGTGYSGAVTNGGIAVLQIYNRLFTDSEILTSYKAMKNRFNLP